MKIIGSNSGDTFVRKNQEIPYKILLPIIGIMLFFNNLSDDCKINAVFI